jgi:hypothetical protein
MDFRVGGSFTQTMQIGDRDNANPLLFVNHNAKT